jgi:hypothetical protein
VGLDVCVRESAGDGDALIGAYHFVVSCHIVNNTTAFSSSSDCDVIIFKAALFIHAASVVISVAAAAAASMPMVRPVVGRARAMSMWVVSLECFKMRFGDGDMHFAAAVTLQIMICAARGRQVRRTARISGESHEGKERFRYVVCFTAPRRSTPACIFSYLFCAVFLSVSMVQA